MGGGVSYNLVIVERSVYGNISFSCNSHRHEDRTSQGNGVERVQEVWEQEDLGICCKTKPSQGLQQHGDQVEQVIAGQHRQQLVEAAPQLRPCKKKDRHNIAQNTKNRDHKLNNSFEQEAEEEEQVHLLHCHLGAGIITLVGTVFQNILNVLSKLIMFIHLCFLVRFLLLKYII